MAQCLIAAQALANNKKKVVAEITFCDETQDVTEVKVGSHHVRHTSDGTDGWCHTHGGFDCELTDEEVAAVNKAKDDWYYANIPF